MSTEHLPATARLRRSLARARVGELRTRHPELQWLFQRFVNTEDVLREWGQLGIADQQELRNVLCANGWEGSLTSRVPVRDLQDPARRTRSVLPCSSVAASKPVLLVVDDDQLLLRATRRMLRACYDVSICTDPDAALRILSERHVDVVVSDFEMPGTKGGLWLLGQVSERYPLVVRILMSSCAVPRDVTTNEVVQRFVPKTAGIDGLVQHISECLEGAIGPAVRAYMVLNAARYLRDQLGGAEARRRFDVLAPATREVLQRAGPADWCPVAIYTQLLHQLAALAEGNEDLVRRQLIIAGESIAREASQSFLRFPMKILSPSLFARKLPDFWKRDSSRGRLEVELTPHKLVCRCFDMAEFDHCLCAGAGFAKFALQSLGVHVDEVVLHGWSLEQPYQEGSSFELIWKS